MFLMNGFLHFNEGNLNVFHVRIAILDFQYFVFQISIPSVTACEGYQTLCCKLCLNAVNTVDAYPSFKSGKCFLLSAVIVYNSLSRMENSPTLCSWVLIRLFFFPSIANYLLFKFILCTR